MPQALAVVSPLIMTEPSMQPRNDFHVIRLDIRCDISVPDEKVNEDWVYG
jgi:hypothetical protein